MTYVICWKLADFLLICATIWNDLLFFEQKLRRITCVNAVEFNSQPAGVLSGQGTWRPTINGCTCPNNPDRRTNRRGSGDAGCTGLRQPRPNRPAENAIPRLRFPAPANKQVKVVHASWNRATADFLEGFSDYLFPGNRLTMRFSKRFLSM